MIRNNNIQSNFTIFDSFHITLWGRLITKFRVEQFLRQGRKLMGYDGGRESGVKRTKKIHFLRKPQFYLTLTFISSYNA